MNKTRKPRRPVAYVAGPYTAETEKEIKINILKARMVALKLFRLGFATHTPHAEMAGWENYKDLQYEQFIKADLEILSRCDVVVLVPGWETSYGTQLELEEAKRLGLPVIYSADQAEAWIKKWKEVNQAA